MSRLSLLRTSFVLAAFATPAIAFAAPPPAAIATSPASPLEQSTQAAYALSKSAADRVDQHINDLRAQLAITEAEQPKWDQFAQVMRDNAAAMHQTIEQRGTGLTRMTAAQNMQSYADLARVHADNMQKLSASFQTLYASLSDEQKAVADRVFRNEHARPEAARKHNG